MNKRKIILLSAIVVLSGAYTLETVFMGGDSVKTVTITDIPDSISIEKGDGSKLLFTKDGDQWTIGEKKYPADIAEIDAVIKAVEKIKVLESVSSGGDDDRYGLGAGGALTVAAKKGGTALRTLSVGKAAANGQQSYLKIDGGKTVLLVSGNFRKTVDKTLDNFRDKKIFELKSSEISGLEISGKENYKLVKVGSPEAWSVAAPAAAAAIKPDKEKLDQWLSSISVLRADGFAPDAPLPAEKPLGAARFTAGNKTATLTVYRKEGDSKYLCASSESPYAFYLPEYAVQRYAKPLKELTGK